MTYEIHAIADIFPRMSDAEFSALKADIQENGLLEPVWLWEEMIIDGRHRFQACEELGLEVESREYTGNDPVGFVVSLNLRRRHLSESQRAMVAANLANMVVGGKEANSANLQNSTSRAEAASLLNVAERSVASAAKVKNEGSIELIAAVQSGRVSVSAAADVATLPKQEQTQIVARGEREILQAAKQIRAVKAEAKREERLEKIAGINTGNAPLSSDRKFPIIYADPPWQYEYIETESRAIENQYPTMSVKDICELPLRDIAQDDCVLFMWATSPKLYEAMLVLLAWGFEYRTCAVWDKEAIGMGYYFRQQHELLLVATRGNVPAPAPADRPSSVLRVKRGPHSQKPEEMRQIIERMYPTLAKIELFCRTPAAGWSAWGNQSNAA